MGISRSLKQITGLKDVDVTADFLLHDSPAVHRYLNMTTSVFLGFYPKRLIELHDCRVILLFYRFNASRVRKKTNKQNKQVGEKILRINSIFRTNPKCKPR